MQNTCSPLEKRLAQHLAASPRLARRTAGSMRVDMVYLDDMTQDRLDSRLRE